MIGKLTGVVDSIHNDHLILDVAGIGYIVYIDDRAKNSLRTQDSVQLFIHSITKDDGVFLYGFDNLAKKEWFLELIKISGISGKIAMLILSSLTLIEIRNALIQKNESAFVSISGIGKKLATRIVNELKNIHLVEEDEFTNPIPEYKPETKDLRTEVISALVNLGISRSRSYFMAHSALEGNPNASLENLIKLALQKK